MKNASIRIFTSEAEANEVAQAARGSVVTTLKPASSPARPTSGSHEGEDEGIYLWNHTAHTIYVVTTKA